MNNSKSITPISVSIIVPIYNVEKYLDRCLSSLLNQTLTNIEIILVDDESPDNCPEMCDEYAKKDNRIKVIHKKNGGLGFARNSGLEIASGEYFAFVDSDDYIELDFYERLYNAAKKDNFDIALGGMSGRYTDKIIRGTHIYAGKVFDKTDIQNILFPSVIGPDIYDRNYSGMSTCKGIYKLSLVKDNNIKFVSEREYISEDAIFDIEIFKYISSAVVIGGSGYYYCYNSVSLSHKYNEQRFEQIKKLCEYELSLIKEYPNYTILKERIIGTFLNNIIAVLKQETENYNKTHKKSDKLKIKNIVRDKYVKEILKDYTIKNLPKKKRILFTFIKSGFWRAVLLITNLRIKQ